MNELKLLVVVLFLVSDCIPTVFLKSPHYRVYAHNEHNSEIVFPVSDTANLVLPYGYEVFHIEIKP